MTRTRGRKDKTKLQAPARAAEIVREYGPFAGADRVVTGVTWVDGELWHGTWEGDESDIRRIDPESGAVLERLAMPRGTVVSGIESDGANLFYCGGGSSGKIRAVRRPKGQQGEK